MTTFDIADLVDIGPDQLGPSNYQELVPGVWIPDPGANELKPGIVNDNNVGMPLYASDIQVRPPGELGPQGMMELGRDTGVWIPHPRSNEMRPGSYTPPAGEKPVQIQDIRFPGDGRAVPPGYVPLGDSGVWIPGPDTVAKSARPASDTTTDPEADQSGGTSNDVFHVNYRQLEGLANNHDQQAEQVAQWANAEQDFADRLLATHGKIAYATYLNVKKFNDSRQAEAGAYAQRNSDTAVGLRTSIESTQSTDESSAAAFRSSTTQV